MKSIDQRSREDFELLVTAHAVGDPAMYELLRDRTLDEDRAKARLTPAEAIALPNEIVMAERD